MNRIIGSIFHINGLAVQSIGFKHYLPVGNVEILAEYLNSWGVDEILLVDICATKNNLVCNPKLVKKVASYIDVPLTVGGGIKKKKDISMMLENGAEKVLISTSLYEKNLWIKKSAETFGSQCLIACIDYRLKDNQINFFSHGGSIQIKKSLKELSKLLESLKVGEVMLHNIEEDGSKKGFDKKFCKIFNKLISKPLIVTGGYGKPQHIVDLWNNISSSVCIGNSLNFQEHSVSKIKSWIRKNSNFSVRIDKEFNYLNKDHDLLF